MRKGSALIMLYWVDCLPGANSFDPGSVSPGISDISVEVNTPKKNL